MLPPFVPIDHLHTLLPLIFIIFVSEVFIDWIKHGFITKFNSISPFVYRKYIAILARDMTNSQNTLVRGKGREEGGRKGRRMKGGMQERRLKEEKKEDIKVKIFYCLYA